MRGASTLNRRKLIRRLAQSRELTLVSAGDLGLRRRRCGRGFRFVDDKGAPIRDKTTLARLKSLAVPPAYQNVRFAADPQAHLQAVGKDDAGRTQYRYHPRWEEVREAGGGHRAPRRR